MPTTSPSSSQHDHPSNPEDTTVNYTTRVARRPRRVRPPAARTAAAIIAAAALAMLAAACSSPSSVSGSPNSGRSANSPSAVGYSACMRSHSVPNFPDPTGTGGIPKESAQHLGVSDSQFTAAQQACQHLLPTYGGSLTAGSLQQCYEADVCPQALVQHAVNAGREFARCMRSRGVPDWPDPTIDSEGRPAFNIRVPRPAPPQVGAAISECERLEHAGSLLAWG
jgi:hypothetical protein